MVFDPKVVAAGADYGSPWESPMGINWVIVGGVITVDGGVLVPSAAAGRYLDTTPLAE